MSESPFVPVEEVMAAMDLPLRAVYNDIRADKLPGEFRNGKPLIKRHLWNQYLRGEWQSGRKPVGIVSIQSKAS